MIITAPLYKARDLEKHPLTSVLVIILQLPHNFPFKYMVQFFFLVSSSESLRNDIGLDLKTPLSNFEKRKKISLLHSSKEKLRR